MNGVAMLPLGWQLARCGFDVVRFSYASVGDGLEHNAARLASLCRQQETKPLHLVGHSLGGLLILAALEKNKDLKVQRVVLIGSPYAGITAAVALARSTIGQRMLGRTLSDWMQMQRPSIPNGVELGVMRETFHLGWAGWWLACKAERWRDAGGRNARSGREGVDRATHQPHRDAGLTCRGARGLCFPAQGDLQACVARF
jgi:pimeloyl-ACP methyl ester carboxylesterase